MPRQARVAPGGLVFHVLNRSIARLPLFRNDRDFEAFRGIMAEALEKHPTRLLAYCLLPNHWHLVLWPRRDAELTAYCRWLTHTHTMRWHAHHHTSGTGHVYQGRFRSFPVEADEHLYTVLRYVERNALRAKRVSRAEGWRWGSLWQRLGGEVPAGLVLHDWPVPQPRNWVALVNRAQTAAELHAVRHAVRRSCPYGSEAWQKRTALRLGLEYTLRPRGRPRKVK